MRISTRAIAAVATLICLTAVVTGCTAETSIDASRATLYSDVASIAADSSAVVEVEVLSQEVVKEDIEYTLSTVAVITPFAPKGLAASLGSATPTAPADTLVVRQFGTTEHTTTPAPILAVGQRYLLFLTPSMLEGDAGTQFYVTGGSAGIYDVTNGSYVHVKSDDGDTLPATLTATDLLG